jgi:hypothetical protein
MADDLDLISRQALLDYFDSLSVSGLDDKTADLVERLFAIFREGIKNAPSIGTM